MLDLEKSDKSSSPSGVPNITNPAQHPVIFRIKIKHFDIVYIETSNASAELARHQKGPIKDVTSCYSDAQRELTIYE